MIALKTLNMTILAGNAKSTQIIPLQSLFGAAYNPPNSPNIKPPRTDAIAFVIVGLNRM